MGRPAKRLRVAAEFGARVRAERLLRGWSQERLAEEVGLHMTYVSSVERGGAERDVADDRQACAGTLSQPGRAGEGPRAEMIRHVAF
jgi:transcriptional regulator with XRE-family HTH domain